MTQHQIHQMKSVPCVPQFKDFFNADGEGRRRQPLQSESNSSGRRSTLNPTYGCQPRQRHAALSQGLHIVTPEGWESPSHHLRDSAHYTVRSWRPLPRALWLPAMTDSLVQDDRKLPLSFIVFIMRDCFTRGRQKNELLSCSGGFITPQAFLLAPRNDVCKCFNFTYIHLH